MRKLRELLRLKLDSKLTHRQIGRALNMSPGTVSYYSQAAQQLDLDWPTLQSLDDEELNQRLEPLAKQFRQRPLQRVTPDWQHIQQMLGGKHVTLMLLWEDYAQANPKRHYSYTQFTRLYKAWCKKHRVTMRLEHRAGEKAFVDYAGTTIPVYSRQTGEVLFQAQVFIMALGHSQYTFVYATRSQSLPDWIEAHRRAFRFFGGVPDVLVPDNLKSGITDSCQFEPEANPTYSEMAEHYHTAIIPARPGTPRDKAIAENAVLLASRWILARLLKQRFYSLNALNNAIAELLTTLNHKPFQKRQGSRHQQFIAHEQASLKPLPDTDYVFATLKHQQVPLDYHVRIDGHHYSVPYQLAREKVLCRLTQTTLEVFHQHRRVASHLRSYEKDGKTTVNAHMPRAHRNYAEWTPQVFWEWAQQSGPDTACVAEHIIKTIKHPERCSKIHFGLKRLAKRFGHERLNQACRRAISLDCIQFKSIESLLTSGLDRASCMQAVNHQHAPSHFNVRGPDYYH